MSSDQYILSEIEFQDMGYTWQPSYMVKGLLVIAAILAGIVAIRFLHSFAKRGEKKLYASDDPLMGVLLSTGFFAGAASLVILLCGCSFRWGSGFATPSGITLW